MSRFMISTVAWTALTLACGIRLVGADEAAETEGDRAAIRQSADAFTKAFNQRDAKTIAAQFTADAEYVAEDGTVLAGREEIAADFAATFEQSPELRIETIVESVRFLGPGVALETGSTRVARHKGEEPTEGRYSVVHVKTSEGWRIARVQEIEKAPPTNYQRLKELEWMVGDWVDEGTDSVVVTSCRWTKNKNFLLRNFKVKIAGRDTIAGTSRIGWDPLTKQIKSWTFDDDGGYAEGLWTRDGDRWIVKSTGVLRTGETASATNVFTYIDDNTCTWQSVDRIVGGELTPNVEELTVVRQPPQPE